MTVHRTIEWLCWYFHIDSLLLGYASNREMSDAFSRLDFKGLHVHLVRYLSQWDKPIRFSVCWGSVHAFVKQLVIQPLLTKHKTIQCLRRVGNEN